MAKKSIDVEARTVTFDFEDGLAPTVIAYDDLPEDMQVMSALHGISQKGGDSYASAKKFAEETGADPVEWSRTQVEAIKAQLANSDWTARTPGGQTVTDLATALAEVQDIEVAEAMAIIAEFGTDDAAKEKKKALRAHPAIKAVLERLRLERQKAKAEKAAAAADAGPDIGDILAA